MPHGNYIFPCLQPFLMAWQQAMHVCFTPLLPVVTSCIPIHLPISIFNSRHVKCNVIIVDKCVYKIRPSIAWQLRANVKEGLDPFWQPFKCGQHATTRKRVVRKMQVSYLYHPTNAQHTFGT